MRIFIHTQVGCLLDWQPRSSKISLPWTPMWTWTEPANHTMQQAQTVVLLYMIRVTFRDAEISCLTWSFRTSPSSSDANPLSFVAYMRATHTHAILSPLRKAAVGSLSSDDEWTRAFIDYYRIRCDFPADVAIFYIYFSRCHCINVILLDICSNRENIKEL